MRIFLTRDGLLAWRNSAERSSARVRDAIATKPGNDIPNSIRAVDSGRLWGNAELGKAFARESRAYSPEGALRKLSRKVLQLFTLGTSGPEKE